MSNLIVNIRFGSWFLQVVQFGDWRSYIKMRQSPVTWSRNDYHDKARLDDPDWRWFRMYQP